MGMPVLRNLFSHSFHCICALYLNRSPPENSMLCPFLLDPKHPVITDRHKILIEQPVALRGLPRASSALSGSRRLRTSLSRLSSSSVLSTRAATCAGSSLLALRVLFATLCVTTSVLPSLSRSSRSTLRTQSTRASSSSSARSTTTLLPTSSSSRLRPSLAPRGPPLCLLCLTT